MDSVWLACLEVPEQRQSQPLRHEADRERAALVLPILLQPESDPCPSFAWWGWDGMDTVLTVHTPTTHPFISSWGPLERWLQKGTSGSSIHRAARAPAAGTLSPRVVHTECVSSLCSYLLLLPSSPSSLLPAPSHLPPPRTLWAPCSQVPLHHLHACHRPLERRKCLLFHRRDR